MFSLIRFPRKRSKVPPNTTAPVAPSLKQPGGGDSRNRRNRVDRERLRAVDGSKHTGTSQTIDLSVSKTFAPRRRTTSNISFTFRELFPFSIIAVGAN